MACQVVPSANEKMIGIVEVHDYTDEENAKSNLLPISSVLIKHNGVKRLWWTPLMTHHREEWLSMRVREKQILLLLRCQDTIRYPRLGISKVRCQNR